jgi:hypothetical protein
LYSLYPLTGHFVSSGSLESVYVEAAGDVAVIFMRTTYQGLEQLAATTLRSMGLTR